MKIVVFIFAYTHSHTDLLVFGWQSSKYFPFLAIRTSTMRSSVIPLRLMFGMPQCCASILVWLQDVLVLALNAKYFPIAVWMGEWTNRSALFTWHSIYLTTHCLCNTYGTSSSSSFTFTFDTNEILLLHIYVYVCVGVYTLSADAFLFSLVVLFFWHFPLLLCCFTFGIRFGVKINKRHFLSPRKRDVEKE